MDPEKAAKMNIEKNKELFEYEMTEVLLKLKGMFAAFSGEGAAYQKTKVSDEQLEIPRIVIPEPSLPECRVEVSVSAPDASFRCPELTAVPSVTVRPVERPVQPAPVSLRPVSAAVSVPEPVSPIDKEKVFPGKLPVFRPRSISVPRPVRFPGQSIAPVQLKPSGTVCVSPALLPPLPRSVSGISVKPAAVTLPDTAAPAGFRAVTVPKPGLTAQELFGSLSLQAPPACPGAIPPVTLKKADIRIPAIRTVWVKK